jgi:hypothetical protein
MIPLTSPIVASIGNLSNVSKLTLLVRPDSKNAELGQITRIQHIA